MRGDKVDGSAPVSSIKSENIGRTRQPRGEIADTVRIATPEAADIVAVAIIPFEKSLGEVTELIAARADIPGLGDQYAVAEERIALQFAKKSGIGFETVAPATKDGRQIEAEAVDSGGGHKVAHGVEDQPARGRMIAGERIAAATVIGERPSFVSQRSEISPIIDPAQRQGWA